MRKKQKPGAANPAPIENEEVETHEEPTVAETRAEIRTIIRQAGGTAEQADELIDQDATVEQARAAAYEIVTTRTQNTPRVRIVSSNDSPQAVLARRQDGVYARVTGAAPSDQGREFYNVPLVDHARAMLAERGVPVVGLSEFDLIQRAHTTSDFPNLLEGVGNRVLLEAFEAAQSPLIQLGRTATAPDFRALNRLGYSTLLVGMIGSHCVNEPAPILAVLPTESDARSFVVDQVEPVFEATPALRGTLSAEKDESGRNTLLHRRFPGGSLSIVAARAPRNLRARTARVLILDEADAMETTAEGSPIKLAEMRTLTFADRKIVMGSTPVFEETSHVIRAYNESDQRVFEVRPPCCETPTEMMWAHIEWPEGKAERAAFRCPHCAELVQEKHKADMVAAGAWRITRPEVKGHAGFRLNALISTLPNASWGKLAAEFWWRRKAPTHCRRSSTRCWGRAGAKTSKTWTSLRCNRELSASGSTPSRPKCASSQRAWMCSATAWKSRS